ncbi:MAG: DUF2147 domain-containing protein [Pseudomonadota bacterium]
MPSRFKTAIVTVIACAAGAAAGQGAVGAAADIDGIWKTEPRDDGSYVSVRIEPCSMEVEARCGTVVEAHGGAKTEIIGDPILAGMEFEGGNQWGGGEIIRPGRGTRYSSKLRLTTDGLEVSGCVAGGLFCGSTLWRR